MKERIKGAFTKRKIFHFLKMALFVVALSLILLSLLGTVAHATGLVDDTINAENLYSKYPLSNYQLDFYVDNSWSWLPWNWLDGIGKSVQYGLYCITNFVWTISLYLSNATGYVVQEAYKLDFINDMADSIGKSIQTLAGVTANGFSSSGFYVGFLLLIILVVGLYVAYTGLIKVLGMNPDDDGLQVVEAEVPMAEMQDFTTFLRQLTQGRGYYTFEFVRYETLPQMLESKVIEKAKALGNFADED